MRRITWPVSRGSKTITFLLCRPLFVCSLCNSYWAMTMIKGRLVLWESFIIRRFSAKKSPKSPQKFAVLGINGITILNTGFKSPKRHILAWNRIVWLILRRNQCVRQFGVKEVNYHALDIVDTWNMLLSSCEWQPFIFHADRHVVYFFSWALCWWNIYVLWKNWNACCLNLQHAVVSLPCQYYWTDTHSVTMRDWSLLEADGCSMHLTSNWSSRHCLNSFLWLWSSEAFLM